MMDAEHRLLGALAWMCEQHLSKDGVLDHSFMSAGEGLIELLVQYGLAEPKPRSAIWADAGRAFLYSS